MGKDMTREEALRHCTTNEVSKVITFSSGAGALGSRGAGIPGFIGGAAGAAVVTSAAAPAFHKRCMRENGGHAPASGPGEAFSQGVDLECRIL